MTNYKVIKNVTEFVREVNKLTKGTPAGFFIFRGQGTHGNDVQSGAYRRLSSTYGKDNTTNSKLIDYHEKIIEGTKKTCESHTTLKDASEMFILGEIQHYGGATNFIDFTYDSLVALYFACRSNGDKKGESKVYCLKTDSVSKFFEISSKDMEISFRELIVKLETSTAEFYKWTPAFNNNRIIKQDSVFVFNGEGKINDEKFDKIFLIKKDYKEGILDELSRGYSKTEESLFPDFVGYVEANAANKPLRKGDSDYYISKGLEFEQMGYYDEALKYYSSGLEIEKEDSPEKATLLNNIGSAFHDKGEYDKAIEYYEKALAINKKYFGEDHPNIATSYNNIGGAFDSRGEYDKAIEYYEKALAIDKKFHREDHPDTAIDYNNIGSAFHNKGEYDKAIEYCEKALAIDKKFYGDEHLKIAIRYNNIGLGFDNKGEYDKAIEYYEKALAIDKKFHGEEHPNIAIRYNNIGGTFDSKGEYDKAIEYYKKALAIDKKFYGDEHPKIAIRYNNIGMAFDNKGEYDKAIEYYEKALEIFRKYLEENHPSIKTATDNIEIAREMRDNK